MKPLNEVLQLTEVTSPIRVRYALRIAQLDSFLIPSRRLVASDGFSGDTFVIKQALPQMCDTFLIFGRTGIEEVILGCVLVADTRAAHIGEYVRFGKYDNLSCDSLGLVVSEKTIHPELLNLNEEIRRQLRGNSEDSRSWASGEWRSGSYLMLDAGFGTRPKQACLLRTLEGEVVGIIFDLSGFLHWIEDD